MDISIQFPSDAVERRRLQNRAAQRRFRQKREKGRHVVVDENDVHTNSEAYPSFGASITGPQYQIQSQLSLPHPANIDVVPQGDSTTLPGLLSTASPSLQVEGSSNNATSHIDPNFWDHNVIDGFLSTTVTGLTPDANPSSPSQFLQELDTTPDGIIGTDIVDNTRISHPLHNNENELQEPRPSNDIRRPLRYRPSARLKESLESVRGDDDDGWLGALHIAAQSGHERMVDILIEQGEDFNEKDSDGRTPLMHAVISGHEGVAQLLLARGARIAPVDRDARSVLHWAALYRRESMLRMFLEPRGDCAVDHPDVDAYDDSGWTPLHMAIYRDFEAGVRMLLQAGARLDSKAQKCPFTRKLDVLGLS
ncbi:ankyrin repeat-containing domain protein [Daldinia vernicosa]|uniref:ankyrin repeat-containing domain protein n=1 Tax=Daldinia vernicosa TaxID=114800 RepID=UPI0020081625|nr:ankyrin repeat-containing domain protein [Daldinia vernicosa]KAI0846104.1 ankyrin repeat-containing domain protein [Daldinia vernicosa]